MQLTARISESMVCTPAKLCRAYLCTRRHQVTQAYSVQTNYLPGGKVLSKLARLNDLSSAALVFSTSACGTQIGCVQGARR